MGHVRRNFQKNLESRQMKMLMDTLHIDVDNGRTVTVGCYVVDNRYVVPYNAHLLKKYRAHINIEACAYVKSVNIYLSISIKVMIVQIWKWL